jgi:hypothetical protein
MAVLGRYSAHKQPASLNPPRKIAERGRVDSRCADSGQRRLPELADAVIVTLWH